MNLEAVPRRFRLDSIPGNLFKHMCDLCNAIEEADESLQSQFLQQWNQYSIRKYESIEFKTYWQSTDQESFVYGSLIKPPTFVADVTYDEVMQIYNFVVSAQGKEYEINYYLDWLKAQFPRSNISDLIFWPDEWFGDESLFRNEDGTFRPESELSSQQVLAYAMATSQRQLSGAPEVAMPYPLPK